MSDASDHWFTFTVARSNPTDTLCATDQMMGTAQSVSSEIELQDGNRAASPNNHAGPLIGPQKPSPGRKFEATTTTTPSSEVVKSAPVHIKPEPQTNECTSSTKNSNDLLPWPFQRYLPPAGPYYDELSLDRIFGVTFFHNKCSVCWGRRHDLKKGAACRETCKICGTQSHHDELCPRLYCSSLWCQKRITQNRLVLIRHAQIRPSKPQISRLQQTGIISIRGGDDSFLFPNLNNPLVINFYKDKPLPRALECVPKWPPSASEANWKGDRIDQRSKAGPQIRNSPLPIHNPSTATGGKLGDHVPADIPFDNGGYYDKAEARIAELENEVLSLKKVAIVKDREIRNLRFENERFGGYDYRTGEKRKRF